MQNYIKSLLYLSTFLFFVFLPLNIVGADYLYCSNGDSGCAGGSCQWGGDYICDCGANAAQCVDQGTYNCVHDFDQDVVCSLNQGCNCLTPPYSGPEYGYQTPPPVYSYQSPYSGPEYGYQTPPPPYGYQYQYQSEYGYPTPSEPYGYPTPYAYPSPAYSYQYQYQSEYPTPVAAFNYSLSNGGTLTIPKNSGNAYGQASITKTLVAGTSESVSLSLSGVPDGVSYSLANGTCSPTCTSTITFTVSSETAVGTYSITVTGTPLSKTTSFSLVVAQPAITVSCAASPSPAKIGVPVTWTGTIVGGTAPYTYIWTGTDFPTSPVPDTNPYIFTYTTVGQKTANLTVTDSTTPNPNVVDCALGGSGSIGLLYVNFNPNFEEF